MFNYVKIVNSLELSVEEKAILVSDLSDRIEKAIFEYDYNDLELKLEEVEDENGIFDRFVFDYKTAVYIKHSFMCEQPEIYIRACQIAKNRRSKIRRLIKFTSKLFKRYKYVYFITYSFSDKDLSLTYKYRRRKVIDFLKIISNEFAMNIDYGNLNNREHYHATIGTNNEINYKDFPENIDFRKVINNGVDIEKLSKYILKLSLHGTKSSTRNNRIMYYRKCEVK